MMTSRAARIKKDIAEFFNKIDKEKETNKWETSRIGPEWAAADSANKFSRGFTLVEGHKLPTPSLIAKGSAKPTEKKKKEKSPVKHKTHNPHSFTKGTGKPTEKKEAKEAPQ